MTPYPEAMAQTALPRSVARYHPGDRRTWVLAVFLFGVGDTVTTGLGLGMDAIVEVGPVVAPIVQQYGIGGVLAVKVAVLCGGFLLWTVLSHPHRTGIPLGLSLVGCVVTFWNTLVLALAVLV